VKYLIAAAVAVSALALAGTASAQVYGNIGYSYLDGDTINLGGPTAKIGWKSSTPLGVEAEGSIGTDKDTTSKGASATRIAMQTQWAGYVTASSNVGETFEAGVRVGYGTMQIKETPGATFTGTPFVNHEDLNSWNYGFFGQWVYDGTSGLRLDYTRMNFSDNGVKDINRYTISWIHKFGVMTK
jgi:hypothetical protein